MGWHDPQCRQACMQDHACVSEATTSTCKAVSATAAGTITARRPAISLASIAKAEKPSSTQTTCRVQEAVLQQTRINASLQPDKTTEMLRTIGTTSFRL